MIYNNSFSGSDIISERMKGSNKIEKVGFISFYVAMDNGVFIRNV